MSTIQEIEDAIQKLPKADLAALRAWFAQFDAAAWDRQLEQDVVTGRLDKLAQEALREFAPQGERPPFRVDEGGAVRVGKSRISLDLIVEQYENGMTPEDMVRAYDTLVLADVHAVIAYYLRHRDEVRAYLKRRAEEAEALRAKVEAEHPRISREELLARCNARERDSTPIGH
jgi:uncharacterized protein (DUF433 family)